MPQRAIVDAGPLVSLLNRQETTHEWAKALFDRFPIFYTCDAVLAEACARLRFYRIPEVGVVELVMRGALRVEFDINRAADRLARLMRKYGDQPMDFADACVVQMSEQMRDCVVFTLDREDFTIYRRFEREVIPFESPP